MFRFLLMCGIFVGGYLLGDKPTMCNCPSVPDNYLFIETESTDTCVEETGKTIVTRKVTQGKSEIYEK